MTLAIVLKLLFTCILTLFLGMGAVKVGDEFDIIPIDILAILLVIVNGIWWIWIR